MISKLLKIRNEFESPEHINGGYNTAPSRRIIQIYSKYEKITDGLNVALDIGLDIIRRECPMFNSWIERIERLASRSLLSMWPLSRSPCRGLCSGRRIRTGLSQVRLDQHVGWGRRCGAQYRRSDYSFC